MKIKIFESEKLIITYWSEFNDNYIPNEILYLFTENNCEYYYVANVKCSPFVRQCGIIEIYQ